jgi:uncharacterized membrane protein
MTQGFTPAIAAHVAAAFAALALGAAMFAARKGTWTHRYAGRAWVALMLAVALSSFWIRSNGSFSWIHVLSVVVPVMLGAGVWLAATGRVSAHRRMMIGVYTGALVITGAFTLLPRRLLGQLVWSSVGLI